MQKIIRSKPLTIDALKTIVEEFILSIDPDMIRKSYSSARRRFEMEILEKGGQFENKKKSSKIQHLLKLPGTRKSILLLSIVR